ncbi:MAG: NAD(+) synthase [Planctomycetes bacterium]|nr:NAD(+) synthase [Planctomycetota bacterium]
MSCTKNLSQAMLKLDADQAIQSLCGTLRHQVGRVFKKRGVVVALSGGIDSSVVGALCVEAFGKDSVFGLLMPEQDSASDTLDLSRVVAEHLGIEYEAEVITPILESVRCYARRDEAIASVIPEYTSEYRCKIVRPQVSENSMVKLFSVVVESPEGVQSQARLTPAAYLKIVAATNFKQRVRKMLEYYHADRLNYAVTGTPNRQEYDQGFFVKLGDGAADVKPIAHLYKTQVYQIARHMGLPEQICMRPPTTDTYSMAQDQDEFYFSVSYQKLDVCLYGLNHDLPIEDVAEAADMSVAQTQQVYQEIKSKRRATATLHFPPLTAREISEIQHQESACSQGRSES